ncbi:MAG TPA: hypothetical protein PKA90_03485 [Ignavibacteria bacterium]|nr:hypothetical protein [Ignavibacteria bacterium]
MSSDCKNKNPLQRSGVNQYQRVLNALKPDFAKADERDLADLILFAKNYAGHIRYFDKTDSGDGDWSGLMSMDISVTLASIIKTDITGCFKYSNNILNEIRNASLLSAAKKNFKVMFDFGFTLISLLDEYYKNLPDGYEFRRLTGSSISSNLPEYLYRLIKFFDEAFIQNLLDPVSEYKTERAPVKIILTQDFDKSVLDEIWDYSSYTFIPSFNGATDILKIKNTANHNLFTGIFDELLKTFTGIINSSGKYLNEVLENFPEHSPHFSLYLAFIKLMQFAQEHLNEFTKRHLDLYYKEILGLKDQHAVSDKVFVNFELHKNTEQHLLNKGTILKAGKDIDGKEIYYSLEKDIVVNRGIVKSLKNVFVKQDISSDTIQVYACQAADSEDGHGGKPGSADESWKTFGSPDTSPLGETGFAIASPYLFLKEGRREITFVFYAAEKGSISFSVNDINNIFELQLSGEKGWFDAAIKSSDVTIDPSKDFFEVKVFLDGGDDSVIPYSSELHLYNFDVKMPVAKFILKNSTAKKEVLNFEFDKIKISTNVSNLKNLKIQNDISILDPAKPFEMFGFSPHAGSSQIIGCKELFAKTINPDGKVSGSINIKWDDFENNYAKIKDNEINVKLLENSEWKTLSSNINIITGKSSKSFKKLTAIQNIQEIKNPLLTREQYAIENTEIKFSIDRMEAEPDYYNEENYTVRSKSGFIKLESDDPFPAEDNLIYSPGIREISLNYNAASVHLFNSSEESGFIHITPFGSKLISGSGNDIKLFHEYKNEGELYIGVENLKEGQTLSVLFKVSEGSADPLAEKEKVFWSYMSNDNEWVDFDEREIEDQTDALVNTGIIKFSISENPVSANSLMTEQYHWIRASVKENTASICKLISVTAQAASAEFYDQKKTGNYFKKTLEADSISKFLISDPAIKKIKQPYSSINGKAKESDEHFYTRVSERLRHKNRAVTMWDYERITLQNFPQIFKVKCINHAQILEKTTGGTTVYSDNEIKPGYTLLIPIPDISNQNAYDPLRPYTPVGLLSDIKKIIYKSVSPHVNLDVRNPLFEEIQLEFRVKFMTDENSFYEKELKAELEKYLAPWAYDPGTDMEFAGSISKSSLIDFIEERSYVDFISCVKMYKISNGIKSKDLEEALADTSRSVFVSVKSDDPVNAHKITFIVNENECECDGR